MTVRREGQQVDSLPTQLYGKKSDGDSKAVLTDDDGNIITVNGLAVPAHDYLALTYVASGNGVGEIETAIYKTGGSGGTTVATLTLTYDSSNRVASVTRT